MLCVPTREGVKSTANSGIRKKVARQSGLILGQCPGWPAKPECHPKSVRMAPVYLFQTFLLGRMIDTIITRAMGSPRSLTWTIREKSDYCDGRCIHWALRVGAVRSPAQQAIFRRGRLVRTEFPGDARGQASIRYFMNVPVPQWSINLIIQDSERHSGCPAIPVAAPRDRAGILDIRQAITTQSGLPVRAATVALPMGEPVCVSAVVALSLTYAQYACESAPRQECTPTR